MQLTNWSGVKIFRMDYNEKKKKRNHWGIIVEIRGY